MAAQQPNSVAQLQRIQVETEPDRFNPRLKIRIEHYDDSLGWYTSGCLSLGLQQLPLLRDALTEFAARKLAGEADNIILFPGC